MCIPGVFSTPSLTPTGGFFIKTVNLHYFSARMDLYGFNKQCQKCVTLVTMFHPFCSLTLIEFEIDKEFYKPNKHINVTET